MMRSFLRKNGSMRNFNMRPTLTELERVSTQGLRSVYECSRAGFLHIQTRQKTTNSKAAKTVPIAGCSSTTPIPSTTSSPTQRDLVYSIMASENVYHPEVLEKEVNSFFEDIDLPMTYYLKFSPQQISNHIHAMIAAKEIAKSSGKDSIEFNVEGREHAMFVCSFDHESVLRMEHLVGNYIHLTPSGYSCSIFSFHSKKGTIGTSKASQPSQDIIIYIATRDAFVSTCEEAADADDIGVLATKEFLSNRPAEVRSGYQEVLRVMKRENIPIFHSFNVANGHTHFTFAAGNSYVTDSHNILPLISRVASEYGLSFENKVVETFANGTVVFSYHAPREFNPSVMSTFLFSLEQLLFTPASLHRMLTVGAPVTLQKIDSSALLYFHMAISFADYFVSQHSDEYAALLVETAKSPRANFHLCNLQKKLIMDSVTYNRVVETITNYAGLCLEIYEDFLSKTKPVDNKKSPPCATSQELNVELFEKARKQVLNSLDLEILQCFILLNSVIRHTNFHHSRKPSVCVELNEQFLKGTPFVSQNSPVHAVIMSLGIGHQGFLTMRSPISRCSLDLLMPKTADEEKRLVSELYFINDVSSKLMHSKTKDVAESGAGCTVVISHLGHHARKAIAMQFVTSVLNVVAETQRLPQGQCLRAPSVVLWGPGVNSYDLMDDITIVARRFANPYANAIAAGKSRKFGGLTDLRAVSASRFEIERFVYEKMGLQPEKMTKIITGSIDEQRTLDELQFSQERIIAVIGRNGVLYDASGLRTEVLVDLGKAKRSILEYPLSDHKSDASNATTQSFPILQFLIARDQKGFSDPFTGEQVTSGDYFCERFLAHPHVSADTVVLCEKRYSPVSRYEVSNFVHSSTQEPKFRLLFEGVDMPLTEDTRSVLERKGVVVLKDTITNKGTGMRSSYEILVALCLSTDDFNSNMIAKNKSLTASDAGQDSRFYSEYANDVVEIIRNAARRDIELVWREHNDPVRNAQNLTRSHITNEISKKVTRLSSQLMALDFLSHKPSIYKDILKNVIPPTLIKRDGIEQIIQRLPEGYKRSLLVKAFTNAYVQRHGLAQDEFCFYEFSKEYFNTGSR